MTYQAAVTVGSEEQDLPVGSAGDVDELVATLSRDDAREATIRAGEEDPAVDAQIHGEHGYLLYAGDEHLVFSVGDPESPALTQASEAGFPEGSGLVMDQFRQALVEFVTNNGALPGSIRWQDADLD